MSQGAVSSGMRVASWEGAALIEWVPGNAKMGPGFLGERNSERFEGDSQVGRLHGDTVEPQALNATRLHAPSVRALLTVGS